MKKHLQNKINGICRRIEKITSKEYPTVYLLTKDINGLRQAVENLMKWVIFDSNLTGSWCDDYEGQVNEKTH